MTAYKRLHVNNTPYPTRLSFFELLPLPSHSLRPQLHPMPSLDLLLQNLIDHLMLLDDAQPAKLCTLNLQRIHRSAPTTDILDLRAQKSSANAPHYPNPLCSLHTAYYMIWGVFGRGLQRSVEPMHDKMCGIHNPPQHNAMHVRHTPHLMKTQCVPLV
jgi:hypothetical protein